MQNWNEHACMLNYINNDANIFTHGILQKVQYNNKIN